MRYRKAKEMDAQDDIEYLVLIPEFIEAKKNASP